MTVKNLKRLAKFLSQFSFMNLALIFLLSTFYAQVLRSSLWFWVKFFIISGIVILQLAIVFFESCRIDAVEKLERNLLEVI